MKNLASVIIAVVLAVAALLFLSCDKSEFACDCNYISEERESTTQPWIVTYRSTWDASCGSEILDESVFYYDGSTTYTRTRIDCKL